MPQYVMSYIGGTSPATQEEADQHFARYMEWLNGLGEALVSPANPLKNTHTIKPDGEVIAESSTQMSGYSIIEADSLDEALDIAKACPFLEIDGTLEVSELVTMPMSDDSE